MQESNTDTTERIATALESIASSLQRMESAIGCTNEQLHDIRDVIGTVSVVIESIPSLG